MRALREWCPTSAPRHTNRKVRCEACNKVLTPYAVFCIGGELVGFRTPPHKTKPKTFKRPSRSGGHARRQRGRR